MFFYLSKIFNIFFDFYNLIILFIIIGILFEFFKKKRINLFFILSLLIIIITSILPTGKFMMNYLEKDFYNNSLPNKIDGIIVLSGAIDPVLSNEYNSIEFNQSSERVIKLLEFNNREIQKVFSGGAGIIFDSSLNQSFFAKKFYKKFNIDNIIFENKSKNTYENINFTYNLIKPNKDENWILITSAYHMKRAISVANSIDWELYPLAVDFQTNKNFIWYKNIKPLANLQIFTRASREILANLIYKYFLL